MNRPTNGLSTVTTPKSVTMIELLGAHVFGSIAFTRDEFRAIQKLYEFAPVDKSHSSDVQNLLQAGADRNASRHAESDGLRLIAWFAKFVPRGEDPLKHLIQLALDAGLDVDPSDAEWSSES